MKIEVEDKPFAVRFKDLKEGDVFKVRADEYYMKMECTGMENSVNLENGELRAVTDEIVVTPVDATLTVSE